MVGNNIKGVRIFIHKYGNKKFNNSIMEAGFLPRGRVLVTTYVRKKRNGATKVKTHLRDKFPKPRKTSTTQSLINYRNRILKNMNKTMYGGNNSFDHLQFISRRLRQVNNVLKSKV